MVRTRFQPSSTCCCSGWTLASAAANALETVLATAPDAAASLDAALAGRAHRVILGRGTARAAADVGALTLKEAAATGCEAQDPAAFRNGPFEVAGPELGAVLIALVVWAIVG